MLIFLVSILVYSETQLSVFSLVTKVTKDLTLDNSVYVIKKLTLFSVSQKICNHHCSQVVTDVEINLRKFSEKNKKCECFKVLEDSTDTHEFAPEMDGAIFLLNG